MPSAGKFVLPFSRGDPDAVSVFAGLLCHLALVGTGHLHRLGHTGWMYLVPIQHHLLSLSKRFGALTVSLNSSVLYVGIAAGGMLGGLTLYALPAYYLRCFRCRSAPSPCCDAVVFPGRSQR